MIALGPHEADQPFHRIVETATTVVCPYATVKTASGGVVTSVIESTTYVSVPSFSCRVLSLTSRITIWVVGLSLTSP